VTTNDASSLKKTARRAGLLYFVMSLIMIFGFLYAPRAFIVNGDAAATARKIIEGERMYRITILASLIGQVLFIFVVLNLYALFKNVDRRQARLMAVLVLVAIAADLVVVANRMAPLDLLIGNNFLSVFTRPQLEALSLGFLYLGGNLTLLLTAFWGLWLIPFGTLTIKSGFFPKILGIVLIIAGVGYIVTSLVSFVFPDHLKEVRRAMTPLYFGEVPIILWLMIMDTKVPTDRVATAT
jgi:glucan phosphoethanolaminetransferase (alkaline phosphatase superfamily)